MMKRKMGIRGLLSRSAKNEPRDTINVSGPISEDRPSTEVDFTSNKYIGRPPPLPSNIERELRDACEFILRDLKPSGHDIEDRRFKSDMFVEQDPYKLEHKVKAAPRPPEDAKRRSQHSAAAWIMTGGEAGARKPPESSTTVDNRAAKPTIDTAKANQKDSRNKPMGNNQLTAMSPLSSHAVPQVESPLAPMPTSTNATRHQSMAASSKMVSSPRPAQRAGSSSTDGSMPFTPSTDRYQSASTAATSTASSNRASDQVYVQQASAKDGEWMKQGVEKHRQSMGTMPSIAATAGAAAVLANDSTSKEEPVPAQKDVPVIQHPQEPVGHHSELDDAQKRALLASRASSRYSGSSWNSQLDGKGAANGTGRPSSGSRRHSRPSSRLSIDGIHETKTSPQATPRNEEVPPVPRIDAERLNSLTSASRSNAANSISPAAITDVAQGNPHYFETQAANKLAAQAVVPDTRHKGFETENENRPSMTSSIPAAQTTSPTSDTRQQQSTGQFVQISKSIAQPYQQNGQASQIPYQQPQRHMTAPTTIVRDFYRPKMPLSAEHAATYRRDDPTPADFDALMGAMNTAVHGPLGAASLPPPSVPPTTSSRTSSMTNGLPNSIPARRSSLAGQRPPPSLTVQTSAPPQQHPQPAHPSQQQPVIQQPPPQPPQRSPKRVSPDRAVSENLQPPGPRHSPPPPDNNTMVNGMSTSPPRSNNASQRSSYISPTRVSEAHSQRSNASRQKERRGVSKLLWRLGGGDMPERRKVYVPNYQTRESADYWEDDEEGACAAPVVGFGRGW